MGLENLKSIFSPGDNGNSTINQDSLLELDSNFDDIVSFTNTDILNFNSNRGDIRPFTNTNILSFNSQYDNGIYEFPIYSGKDRFHPTQKSLPLFKKLVEKHSNKCDIVVDPYGGSATTYVAARELDRVCISGEPSTDYYEKSLARINSNLYIT